MEGVSLGKVETGRAWGFGFVSCLTGLAEENLVLGTGVCAGGRLGGM